MTVYSSDCQRGGPALSGLWRGYSRAIVVRATP
jgi:hypothetical protein